MYDSIFRRKVVVGKKFAIIFNHFGMPEKGIINFICISSGCMKSPRSDVLFVFPVRFAHPGQQSARNPFATMELQHGGSIKFWAAIV